MLDTEIQIFNARQNELQKTHPKGGFAVIYKDRFLGVWNDRSEALRAGLSEFGNIQFLVKSIFEQARTVNFTQKINR